MWPLVMFKGICSLEGTGTDAEVLHAAGCKPSWLFGRQWHRNVCRAGHQAVPAFHRPKPPRRAVSRADPQQPALMTWHFNGSFTSLVNDVHKSNYTLAAKHQPRQLLMLGLMQLVGWSMTRP